MNDPLQRLKVMPWAGLFQVAALTTVMAILLDLLVMLLILFSPLTRATLMLLFADPLGIIMNVVVYTGVGALAVFLMSTVFRKLSINIANLWGLIFALIVIMITASTLTAMLNIPSLLISADQGSVLGLILGVFGTTWRHWRYSSIGGCRRCR